MALRTVSRRKRSTPRWVMSESGEAVAVLMDIEEYQEMQRRLGEIATREEEGDPEALALLERAEADVKAGKLTPHTEIKLAVRKRRRRND